MHWGLRRPIYPLSSELGSENSPVIYWPNTNPAIPTQYCGLSAPLGLLHESAMFDTIDDDDVELPVSPVAESTVEDLEEYPPLHRENYKGFKIDLLKWLLRTGKAPDEGDGYAIETVRQTHYRIEHAYRWKWEKDGITTDFTPDDADDLIKLLNARTTKPERSQSTKRRSSDCSNTSIARRDAITSGTPDT